jgi:signal transduction histidine kinase
MQQHYHGTINHALHRSFATQAFATRAILFVYVLLICSLAPLRGQNMYLEYMISQQDVPQQFTPQHFVPQQFVANSLRKMLCENRSEALWGETFGDGIAQKKRYVRRFATIVSRGSLQERKSAFASAEPSTGQGVATSEDDQYTALQSPAHLYWWQTVWAKLALVFAVAAGAFALYRWRERRVEKRQQDLERIIAERTAEISVGHDEIIRQNDVLMQLNIEKNEFLGIAAHDLKNPLTSIILSASIIQQYQTRMTVPEINDQMDHILITAKRMQETILNLLDINAIESGRFTFNPIAMNVVEVVNDVVEGYYLRAKDKEITLHFNHDSDEVMTMCDRNALMQVLENLISNAIKYSPLGKNVYVNVLSSSNDGRSTLFSREKNAVERLPMAQPHVRIEFQDEGPGLTPEDKEQLFHKFAKLSAKPTGGEHSTGLGLSIVKKIIEAMHGQVWCESEIHHGATFIVELPINEVPMELLLERLS